MVLAADGLDGIEQFRANKPDLVLLDCMLPKIDGFAVCEILRKESQVPDVYKRQIKASHSHDVLEMSGSRAVWKEVLAVYAVKTTTDPDNAQEVATRCV